MRGGGTSKIVLAAAMLVIAGASSTHAAAAKICVKSELMHLFGGCEKPDADESAKNTAAVLRARPVPHHGFASRLGDRIGNVRLHHYASYGRSGGPAVFLQLESQPADPEKPVRLMMRCLDDETNILFEFPGRSMSDVREKSELFYSVDGSEPKIVELSLATGDGSSVMGMWHGYRAIGFARTLLGKSTLEMQAWDTENRQFSFSFDISSLEEALRPLRTACRW
jgi:hypothetical protein